MQVLQGEPAMLRQYADQLIGLRGVKHGELVLSSAGLWWGHGNEGDVGVSVSAEHHHHHGQEE